MLVKFEVLVFVVEVLVVTSPSFARVSFLAIAATVLIPVEEKTEAVQAE